MFVIINMAMDIWVEILEVIKFIFIILIVDIIILKLTQNISKRLIIVEIIVSLVKIVRRQIKIIKVHLWKLIFILSSTTDNSSIVIVKIIFLNNVQALLNQRQVQFLCILVLSFIWID